MAQGLKLGYKASAEQFGPRELVELGVLAEAHGMEPGHDQKRFLELFERDLAPRLRALA
ncbi:hypothetical protein KUG88_07165 [Rhodococcus rhodochrous]|nr:hypothetical protein [Rhodococcus rhodochrous]MCB8909908.1 hypothetical protein [Rhodococcus rhodochrous]